MLAAVKARDADPVNACLEHANQRSRDLLLHGGDAQAQNVFIAESNPAFERLLSTISWNQDEISRRRMPPAMALTPRLKRREPPCRSWLECGQAPPPAR
jgi:hypothetical protein